MGSATQPGCCGCGGGGGGGIGVSQCGCVNIPATMNLTIPSGNVFSLPAGISTMTGYGFGATFPFTSPIAMNVGWYSAEYTLSGLFFRMVVICASGSGTSIPGCWNLYSFAGGASNTYGGASPIIYWPIPNINNICFPFAYSAAAYVPPTFTGPAPGYTMGP